ncbi:MAG: hypothetical protein WCA82_15805, partial [Jiangellales bacterium]
QWREHHLDVLGVGGVQRVVVGALVAVVDTREVRAVRRPVGEASLAAVDARAAQTYGKAYRDVARAFERRWENSPDLVALPTTERHVIDVLDWATSCDVAVVPYGGVSSVVGGVEADLSTLGVITETWLRVHVGRLRPTDCTPRSPRPSATR